MRQIVLDTETTGLEVDRNHRIIEIGCVEMLNRRITGRTFHQYLNPERDIDAGAQAVHGLSSERLATEPKFAEVAPRLLEFIQGAELVIHNAPFDVAFLNAELRRLGDEAADIAAICSVSLNSHARRSSMAMKFSRPSSIRTEASRSNSA